ncbi:MULTISPECIES: hypothetical protein [Bradyrhizobium]|jgi:hypothetical protein|uniref:Uncharacterized protein n=1 Tax=Bradyrhizobium arachidis TaxID=858423 RepID=A0AAE7NXT2_9BRAD|nr:MULTISPECIES: hypothetical protein [Bradyrhizobium]QOG18339.1 hypothetical protein FOM02_14305 [Bradyrhizobium sp. SEMIA]QOZ72271.1 hypothetical protein WN72_42745 [Bradyrhizobium arachidis]UFW48717.1 hypothetical protein BaraCB756_41865 [Bradyrhizobium arachidis]SFU88743.1 hypothetical protein SAMN05192541_106322 [Bradyrhizobium arachidis]
MIRHLMVPITVAMISLGAAGAYAQSAFPAPLPNQAASSSAFPPVNGSAPTASVGAAPQSSFPVNGAAPIGGAGAFSAAPPTQAGSGEDCMKAFLPLREEAEKRGKLIKAASDRHAPPDEACKLIRNFSQAETNMLKYIEKNSAKCGIPAQVGAQMKEGHKNTEAMTTKVCNVAQQMQQQQARPAGPSLSEVLGSGSAPEANAGKKGGSTFDTLNGNVLTR